MPYDAENIVVLFRSTRNARCCTTILPLTEIPDDALPRPLECIGKEMNELPTGLLDIDLEAGTYTAEYSTRQRIYNPTVTRDIGSSISNTRPLRGQLLGVFDRINDEHLTSMLLAHHSAIKSRTPHFD